MLISLVALMTAMVGGEFSWLAADTSHVTLTMPRPLVTPEEPATLTLALIGIGTIGVYLAVSRLLWRGRGTEPSEKPAAADTVETVEQPSRGAA